MKILVRREVVQRGTPDGLWLVVLGDPGRDPARIGRGTTPEEATATAVGARPRPEATADEVVHLPPRTSCWKAWSVIALSVPMKPPIAMTGLPVASSKGAAWGADVVAPTQRYWLAPASSRDTTALLTV